MLGVYNSYIISYIIIYNTYKRIKDDYEVTSVHQPSYRITATYGKMPVPVPYRPSYRRENIFDGNTSTIWQSARERPGVTINLKVF